jgi:membrane-bound lytic murein transglycosylase D
MIRAKMRAGGLPEDMYYLALIESGFDPNAYSRAAAVGMWQFMTSTARDLGMRVDWWVDERRDPVKSTDGAVRFIKDLQAQFGSLYLAAAAYNGGPGRIARGLSRYADDLEGTTGDDLFFALADKDYLRSETREYVPQLIAAALVAKEPARYGMVINAEAAFAYDSVRVGPATPLAAIAKAAGATIVQIQGLNPQILRGVTPPKDSLIIRLPVGAADSFPNAYAALPKSDRIGLSTVETKKGQSMASVANKAGLTAKQLSTYNPRAQRLKSGNLAPGQFLMLPTPAVVAAAVSVPDPSIERYSSSRYTTMHVVRSGETIGGIAKRYHTTTAALMRANHLKRALIFPGQSLVVNAGSKRSASASHSQTPSTKKRKVGAASSSTHSSPL